jgi:ABC-type phosphate transport system substrate-binding protein
VAVAAPAVASAEETNKIKGQGSTLQEVAQHEVFIPGFNKLGEGEVTEYKGTGSGPGLEAWGANGHAPEFSTWDYVGTDQPPNTAQKAEIEKAAGGATVLSIPTLQAAVAIVMHLPKGCTAAKSKNKTSAHRLVLNNKTLEGVFRHTITKWSELKDDGDALTCASKEDEEAPIIRVVRLEGSGTTAITKKYLNQINKETAVDGELTWNDLAEENPNTKWPAEGEDLVRGKGSGGIVSTTADTYGSIGYVNLANAYASTCFRGPSCEVEIEKGVKTTLKGGEGGETFWAFVQNNGLAAKGTYQNPEKVVEGKEGPSNCEGVEYVNGVGKTFPPKSTTEAWNEVTAKTKEKKYTLCGFTYDLSLVGFSKIPPAVQPGKEEVETIKSYFKFMVTTGAKELATFGYLELPTNKNAKKSVKKLAEEGAAKISE